MTIGTLAAFLGFMFISLIWMKMKLDRAAANAQLAMQQALIHSIMLGSIIQALIGKKILSQSDLAFLNQEEDILAKLESVMPKEEPEKK